MCAAPTEGWKVVPFAGHMFDRKGLGAAQRPPPTKEHIYRLNKHVLPATFRTNQGGGPHRKIQSCCVVPLRRGRWSRLPTRSAVDACRQQAPPPSALRPSLSFGSLGRGAQGAGGAFPVLGSLLEGRKPPVAAVLRFDRVGRREAGWPKARLRECP